jgi:hypothetical protein
MKTSRQIEMALFDAALGLPDAEAREAFLDRVCNGEPGLRARLTTLLVAHEVAEPFFDIDPLEATGQESESEDIEVPDGTLPNEGKSHSIERADARIGRYKLIERIGEGGCGVVYLAEQQKPVKRQVALKIIRMGMNTERVIARFERERQALAMMNHPNIAQVLDAGTTETGRPYFVMELVQGVRITDYCDEHRLDLATRLELFARVCLAIQYAHQKGIIHRDVKPSNVLVATHGDVAIPKIIDFGIAKAIEAGEEAEFAAAEQLVGTPAYMSPEQAETGGADVDTRSDIYSLGVLLYELIAGYAPFNADDLLKLEVEEMRRALCEREPQKPSERLRSLEPSELAEIAARRRIEPSKLISALRDDLDWIAMKALQKDRQRRYATANGLAVDVQRYLHGEPVSARPRSRLYWFRKLIRRNRATFTAIVAITAALIVGLGTSTWLFLREREVRHQKEHLLAEAEKNEMVTRAVFLVRADKYEEANAVLKQIATPPSRPSFDGVSAFRAVGEWLAAQKRWQEAAARYSMVVHLDSLDIWSPVTLDYQACGALLLEIGDIPGYERFRAAALSRYATEENIDAATRILKTCLLLPMDQHALDAMQPVGEKAMQRPAAIPGNPWALIPASLWQYRRGNYQEVVTAASHYNNLVDRSAAAATLDLIVCMALTHEGRHAEAQRLLDRGRSTVQDGLRDRLAHGNGVFGFWYDWVFADVLLREAEKTMHSQAAGNPDASTPPSLPK